MIRSTVSRLSVAVLFAALSSATLARADALPPNSCAGSPAGATCDSAGPHYDQPGICVAKTCNRPVVDASVDCSTCELAAPVDGGAPDGAASADAGRPAEPADGSTSAPTASLQSDSSKCSIRAVGSGSVGFGIIAIGGAVALAWMRRRRGEMKR